MNQNLDTLKGGRKLTVTFELAKAEGTAPRKEEVFVRQIPVRDYDEGLNLLNDELGLVAFLAKKPRTWAEGISPESYEEILSVGRQVNEKHFFASCRRRIEARIQEAALLEAARAAAITRLPESERIAIQTQAQRILSPLSASTPL